VCPVYCRVFSQILSPIAIPHPKISFTRTSGDVHVRTFRALGIHTEGKENPSYILPGDSISGWAYYLLDGIIDDKHVPFQKNNEIPVELSKSSNVFRKRFPSLRGRCPFARSNPQLCDGDCFAAKNTAHNDGVKLFSTIYLVVTDVFGNKARIKITMTPISLEKAKFYISDLDEIA